MAAGPHAALSWWRATWGCASSCVCAVVFACVKDEGHETDDEPYMHGNAACPCAVKQPRGWWPKVRHPAHPAKKVLGEVRVGGAGSGAGWARGNRGGQVGVKAVLFRASSPVLSVAIAASVCLLWVGLRRGAPTTRGRRGSVAAVAVPRLGGSAAGDEAKQKAPRAHAENSGARVKRVKDTRRFTNRQNLADLWPRCPPLQGPPVVRRALMCQSVRSPCPIHVLTMSPIPHTHVRAALSFFFPR